MTVVNSEIDIASYIDHSLLSPTAIAQEVEQYCQQANQFGFPTVCVYPSMVRKATELLQGKQSQVCTVIGFPTGATTSAVKLYEAKEAVDNGATELDVVINLGWLKTGLSDKIYQEIAEICAETKQTVKVILETNLLTDTEKRLAAEICMDGGATYLKTSTGWFGGATVADVSYLNQLAKGRVGIKASGGIRTLEQALALIEAGATRLGTSHGVDLVKQQRGLVQNI
ncbi:MAG: deoxyribose-phosphate aldolase [cyanobacterium endosymbiont of Rhopalodia musculus]|uniref:deoxyribose-phosphate aldolase n=1 Tax=cyanobacterium endosymbiont of Epithemia clementina EcSB TaxID=3034674 RepID=UPI002480193A|nr:deoxyribose-phosphate aldolase [cyanobacterium endosymbiont of Epithemia clementina EcSB]WGT67916.1 deoxyribose-phosphate aldolase [cyanobacterium endosymbiont of Epithemia clementina EcSB]